METTPEHIPLNYSLDDFKGTVNENLKLDDSRVVDITAAATVANLFKSDPLWLMLVGPPSSGKTEMLNALEGLDFIQHLSIWTPQTLISGKPKKNKEPSLLFRLDGKILVVKDFTTILSMRHEPRAEIISQLREVFDGKMSKAFGNEMDVKWEGHVGFIGAVTPIYDQYHAVISAMGDRFTLFRYHNGNGLECGMMAIDRVGREAGMRTELRKAASRFLGQFCNRKPLKVIVDKERREMIVRAAEFAGLLRTSVDRDPYTKEILYEPEPEGTPRLSKQIFQVGIALATIQDKQTIDDEIYTILVKLALDAGPVMRAKALRYLWESQCWEQTAFWSTSTEVAAAIEKPTKTALRTLEDLMILGLCRRDSSGKSESTGYRWQLSEKIVNIISFAELFPEPGAI
jgi:hypothetical protein